MSLRPDVTVAAVVECDGRFLLVEEHIGSRRVINQPAGHVEEGETLLEAVVRETREESAWRLTPGSLLGIYLWNHPVTRRAILRFAFVGEVSDHDASQPLDRGIVRTLWLGRDDLLARQARQRSPLVLRCVDDYLRGQRLPLDSVAYLDVESAVTARAVNI
jgi:8-oxo-dGTP pyrophosphatase MutT (NUDIX family)